MPYHFHIYRRVVRRKSNLEVTGEEKPKTRLRRRKDNKRLCHEKSQFAPSQTKKSQFHLSQTKKASLRRPRTKNYNKRHFARKKTNKKHLRDYPWYQLHLNLCGWVLWNETSPVLEICIMRAHMYVCIYSNEFLLKTLAFQQNRKSQNHKRYMYIYYLKL